MASDDNFWQNFEQFLGYPLPNEIKSILNKTGFNYELAISELNSEFILEITATSNHTYIFTWSHGITQKN